MNIRMLITCLSAWFLLSSLSTALAADPPFAAWVTPITRPELLRTIHAANTTPEQHALTIGRATYSRLEEVALAAYQTEAQHYPQNPVLQSAFGLMYFNEAYDARTGQYKPSDPDLWQRQMNDMALLRSATAAVEQPPKTAGRSIWFCWFALGECHAIGLEDTDGQGRNVERQAQIELKEAARLNPNSFAIHDWLGLTCLPPAGSAEDALREAQKAVSLDHTDASAFDIESRAYAFLKLYKQAYVAKKRAIELTPPGQPIPAYVYSNLAGLKREADL